MEKDSVSIVKGESWEDHIRVIRLPKLVSSSSRQIRRLTSSDCRGLSFSSAIRVVATNLQVIEELSESARAVMVVRMRVTTGTPCRLARLRSIADVACSASSLRHKVLDVCMWKRGR